MKAGFGKAKITPKLGVELSGYGYFLGRRAESVMDDLYARCIALEEEGKRYYIISCDLTGIGREPIDKANEMLKEEYKAGESSLFICSTHTHTGPSGGKEYVGCGEANTEYSLYLPDKIVESAKNAVMDIGEVECVESSQKEIEPVGYNRSMQGGPEDHFVRGLLLRRRDKNDIALVSYGCHPVTLGCIAAVSADYPGKVCEAMEKASIDAVFLTGLCGDIDPVSNKTAWGSGTVDTITGYGARIAEGFLSGISDKSEKSETSPKLRYHVIDVDLPCGPFDKEKIKATADKILSEHTSDARSEAHKKVVAAWRDHMFKRIERGEDISAEKGKAFVLSLGDNIVMGINYETFTEIGMNIRKALAGKNIIIAGNADESLGYFPSEQKLGETGYESFASSFLYKKLPLRKGAADLFVASVIEGISKK